MSTSSAPVVLDQIINTLSDLLVGKGEDGSVLDDGSTLEGLGLGALAELSVSTLPPPADPWRKLRSPYGGKLSPADEWTKLCARTELGARRCVGGVIGWGWRQGS